MSNITQQLTNATTYELIAQLEVDYMNHVAGCMKSKVGISHPEWDVVGNMFYHLHVNRSGMFGSIPICIESYMDISGSLIVSNPVTTP